LLHWRLILGTLLIAAVGGLCWLDFHAATPGIWFMPIALLLAALASQEVLCLLAAREWHPIPAVVYVGNLAIVASNFVPVLRGEMRPNAWGFVAFTLMILVAFIGEMRRYTQPGKSMIQVGLTILALAYVGLLISMLCQLRFVLGPRAGLVALASLIVVVKFGDIGAYTVGRLIGRTKMVPVLSPGKTWEGAAGAVVFSILGGLLMIAGLLPAVTEPSIRFPWYFAILYGIAVGIAGMLGDLAESLFKRDMGRKDSSDWMPGFGGVLDILDSVLFAAPVAFLAWQIMSLAGSS
jgi:phosphatidate cytidylyltransferase